MSFAEFLSSRDTHRLKEIGVAFESPTRKLLPKAIHNNLKLLELDNENSISDEYMHSSGLTESELGNAYCEYLEKKFSERYGRAKVSPALSDYLWSSEEGDDQIEFRSPVPDFPPPGQLMVVSSNGKRKKEVGKYCLAACDDGIVRWRHESECVNKRNHVWMVHLFDLRGGGAVYFGDRLQQPERNVYINNVDTYIGGNVNGSGTLVADDSNRESQF